ncbi:Mobile element protein (plasmid) [Salipiger profundus]|uniref:Mobile element protein n=1 Tax=Salipiger profundus TaxID=1229727 RepID=A0A1U7DDB0_9RHOB|nr:Mobile element protein [Salipiger profundus]
MLVMQRGLYDARGYSQLARTGWFTAVHVRSEEADRLRCLVAARERLIRSRKDLEGHIRGVLKTFGIRMIGIGQGRQRQAFRDQLAAAGETDPVLGAMANAFIVTRAKLCQVAEDLDKAVKKTAKAHPVARRLMTIPGVGPAPGSCGWWPDCNDLRPRCRWTVRSGRHAWPSEPLEGG